MTQLLPLQGSSRFQSDAMAVYIYSKLPDGDIAVLEVVQERPNACKKAEAGLQAICGCLTCKLVSTGLQFYHIPEKYYSCLNHSLTYAVLCI